MEDRLSVLGFAGSLRKESYNRTLLSCARDVAPENIAIEIFELDGIPPFNQDFENEPPRKVREFKKKIRSADAILIATPEYNYSVPGVLKNAIDWASRPFGDNAFDGKPVAVMGASIGMTGTARAQHHLRQSFVFLNMYPVNQPEVMVPYASERIRGGKVIDEQTRSKIVQLLESLADWTRKLYPAEVRSKGSARRIAR